MNVESAGVILVAFLATLIPILFLVQDLSKGRWHRLLEYVVSAGAAVAALVALVALLLLLDASGPTTLATSVSLIIFASLLLLVRRFFEWRPIFQYLATGIVSISIAAFLLLTGHDLLPNEHVPPPSQVLPGPRPSEGPHGPPTSMPLPPAPYDWRDRPYRVFPRFPWHPPTPSVFLVLPSELLTQRMIAVRFADGIDRKSAVEHLELRDLAFVLATSMVAAGYGEISYYSVPRGFAVVAQLERTNSDGTPFAETNRFNPNFVPLPRFTLQDYLKALLLAPPGYYRVIAFIVTPEPFVADGKPISADEATQLVERGAVLLPNFIGQQKVTDDTHCTALVYEFEKRDAGSNPSERLPGRLSALVHLKKSGIWSTLWTSR